MPTLGQPKWQDPGNWIRPQVRRLAGRLSEDLRDSRRLDYGHSVELDAGNFRVRVGPIHSSRGCFVLGYEVGFRATAHRGTLDVSTRTASGLLQFEIFGSDPGEELRERAYIAALGAAHALLCAPPSTASGSGGVGYVLWSPAEVAGHVRQLPSGQVASSEQVVLAAATGITLRSGETYVRQHGRSGGVPEGTVRQVAWHPDLDVLRGAIPLLS